MLIFTYKNEQSLMFLVCLSTLTQLVLSIYSSEEDSREFDDGRLWTPVTPEATTSKIYLSDVYFAPPWHPNQTDHPNKVYCKKDYWWRPYIEKMERPPPAIFARYLRWKRSSIDSSNVTTTTNTANIFIGTYNPSNEADDKEFPLHGHGVKRSINIDQGTSIELSNTKNSYMEEPVSNKIAYNGDASNLNADVERGNEFNSWRMFKKTTENEEKFVSVLPEDWSYMLPYKIRDNQHKYEQKYETSATTREIILKYSRFNGERVSKDHVKAASMYQKWREMKHLSTVAELEYPKSNLISENKFNTKMEPYQVEKTILNNSFLTPNFRVKRAVKKKKTKKEKTRKITTTTIMRKTTTVNPSRMAKLQKIIRKTAVPNLRKLRGDDETSTTGLWDKLTGLPFYKPNSTYRTHAPSHARYSILKIDDFPEYEEYDSEETKPMTTMSTTTTTKPTTTHPEVITTRSTPVAEFTFTGSIFEYSVKVKLPKIVGTIDKEELSRYTKPWLKTTVDPSLVLSPQSYVSEKKGNTLQGKNNQQQQKSKNAGKEMWKQKSKGRFTFRGKSHTSKPPASS